MNFEFSDKATFQEYFGPAHKMVRRSVKEFVDKEIVPNIEDWEEKNEFPRDLYKKAGDVGILGIGYPEKLGGTPGDIFFQIAAWEEIMRCGSGGVAAGLGSLNIAIPPIISHGTDEQKERFVKPVIMGDKIAALAITEPGGGSDVAGFQVMRHKIVDMATLVEVSREFTYRVAAKIGAGINQVKEISMAKNFACTTGDKVTYDAVQIFGGCGFMRGYPVERLFRDNRVLSIGGGTTEIMKEIISKHIFK